MSQHPILCVVAPTADDRAQLRLAPPGGDSELWAIFDHRGLHDDSPRPPMRRHVRVQDARRGTSLERVALAALRLRAPWVAFWFPRAGSVPDENRLLQLDANHRDADVLIMPSINGLCRLFAFRRAPSELLRELQWQTAPDADDLRQHALRLGLSCYRFPARA